LRHKVLLISKNGLLEDINASLGSRFELAIDSRMLAASAREERTAELLMKGQEDQVAAQKRWIIWQEGNVPDA
jgi:hypothetical protein